MVVIAIATRYVPSSATLHLVYASPRTSQPYAENGALDGMAGDACLTWENARSKKVTHHVLWDAIFQGIVAAREAEPWLHRSRDEHSKGATQQTAHARTVGDIGRRVGHCHAIAMPPW